MFRMKKSSSGEGQESTPSDRPDTPVEDPPVKAPVRRATPVPARPLGGPSYPIELPRRDIGSATLVRGEPAPAVTRDKSIIVGKDVRLQGEVTACDRLIVEGEADLKVSGCRSLQIGATGVFRGTADVVEADVAGTFEGELSTRDRLAVRATGRLDGRFQYGQITIDAGGRIVGEVGLTPPPAEAADTDALSDASPAGASPVETTTGPRLATAAAAPPAPAGTPDMALATVDRS